jgi:hypothetical protein
MTLVDAVSRFTEPPGNLIYHIVLAMTLAVVFSLAQIFRRNLYGPTASRWLFVGAGLLILRLIILAIEGLHWLDLIGGERLIPAIDRFASFTGLLAFMWANQLPTPKTSTWILAAGSVFNFVVIMLAPFLLSDQIDAASFNHTMIDAFWSFASLLVAFLSGIFLLTSRPRGWENSFSPFAVIGVGILLHISLGQTTEAVPGFVHLAELAAYPLIALAGAKQMATLQVGEIAEPVTVGDSTPPAHGIAYLEVATDVATSPFSNEWEEFARQAVEILSRGLKIECCILYSKPDDPSHIEISAGYILSKNFYLPPQTYESKRTPKLSHALSKGVRTQLDENSDKAELLELGSIIGFKEERPFYQFPINVGRNVLGAILCSSPFSIDPFTRSNQARFAELVSILAYQIGEWLHREYSSDDFVADPYPPTDSESIQLLENENLQLRDALKTLQGRMVKQGDMESLLSMHDRDQNEIQRLEAEVNRLNSAFDLGLGLKNEKEIEDLRNERQLALQELADLRKSLTVMERIAREAKQKKPEPLPKKAEMEHIAQELRRPMASILGYTEILMGDAVGVLDNVQKSFLEKIRNASQSMVALLNDLNQL